MHWAIHIICNIVNQGAVLISFFRKFSVRKPSSCKDLQESILLNFRKHFPFTNSRKTYDHPTSCNIWQTTSQLVPMMLSKIDSSNLTSWTLVLLRSKYQSICSSKHLHVIVYCLSVVLQDVDESIWCKIIDEAKSRFV